MTFKYQRSNKKHENTVSTTESDLTFTQTAWQMHYFKTNLDTAGLSGCIPVT